ncbi:hypothetical protein FBU30_011296 [Linnemannia zychae]|nr:hypothetical protein FBU30_011296 [Linnemannia zychae]
MESVNSEDIVQFCAITSADPDVASNYLTVCDGSLDRAISLYMESGGVDLSGAMSASDNANNTSRGERRSRSSSNDGIDDFGNSINQDEELARSLQEEDSRASQSIRAPIAPRHEMLLGDDFSSNTSSMFQGSSSRARAAPSVFLPPDSSTLARDAFRDFAAEAATMGGDSSPKTSRLADLFKAPFDMMARGDFDQSRNVAKRETKWLMVNIQEAGVFACQVLNRDLWSDQSVKEIVKENFIFLQLKECMSGARQSIQLTFFLMVMSEFLDINSLTDSASKPSLPKKKKIVKDVSDMTEEEQIEAAMMASMGGDVSSAIDIPDEESEDIKTPAEDEMEPQSESVQESVFDSIKPVRHEEPTDLANSTRIGFRLSDGSRLMHRFSKSAPVRVLFEYIKSEVEDARTQPFELVFLGKQLLDDVDKTLSEVGVENAQIMVQM